MWISICSTFNLVMRNNRLIYKCVLLWYVVLLYCHLGKSPELLRWQISTPTSTYPFSCCLHIFRRAHGYGWMHFARSGELQDLSWSSFMTTPPWMGWYFKTFCDYSPMMGCYFKTFHDQVSLPQTLGCTGCTLLVSFATLFLEEIALLFHCLSGNNIAISDVTTYPFLVMVRTVFLSQLHISRLFNLSPRPLTLREHAFRSIKQ